MTIGYPIRDRVRCWAMERRSNVGGRRGRGICRPSGAGLHGGTEPSAHALGYRLAALRAWGQGLGKVCVVRICGVGALRDAVLATTALRDQPRWRWWGKGPAA
jgi:hypothetical protein